MNTSENKRPGILCRVVRLWSVFSERASRSHHAETCASCRAVFEKDATFDRALRRDAHRAQRPLPDGFEQLVMAGVRQAARAPEPTTPHRRYLPLSLAGVVAAAAVVAIVVLSHQSTPSNSREPLVAANDFDEADVRQVVAAVEKLPSVVRSKVAPSAVKYTRDNPLVGELDNVYADARSAISFLALNFLPEDEIPNGATSPGYSGEHRG